MAPKGQMHTSWDDADFIESVLGNAALFDIGDESDPNRPAVALVKYAPGAEVPPHYHGCDYFSVVIDGEIEITRKLHRAGSVRIVKAGTAYGPLKVGPNGARVVEVFADRANLFATFLASGGQQSETFRALQEEVRPQLS